jgi:hypothetical protein
MPKQTRPEDDNTVPNRSANMEPAEGSRENAGGDDAGQGGGISNRSTGEESARQNNLPPRGESKGGSHA